MLHSVNVCIIKKGKKVILIVLIREFRFKCPSRFPGSAALPDNWPVSTPIANELYGHFAHVFCVAEQQRKLTVRLELEL